MPAWLIALAPKLLDILTPLIPDPSAREKAVQGILGMFLDADKGQLEVNKAEAASGNWMAATWRPAIGWACASALWFQYVLSPVAIWVGFLVGHPIPKPPELDSVLWELMFGMLGMGALRSYEKVRGVTK